MLKGTSFYQYFKSYVIYQNSGKESRETGKFAKDIIKTIESRRNPTNEKVPPVKGAPAQRK